MAQGPGAPRTTVVVVTWRGVAHLGACLAALDAQDRPHRTLVVDNASDDGTEEIIRAHQAPPGQPPAVVLRLPENRGYAGGLAAAMPEVDTGYVAWLNDDAAPEPGWLAALESVLDERPETAAVGSRLVRPDGAPQSAGVRITADGHGADLVEPPADRGPTGEEVFGFCGGAVLLRTAALRSIGGVPAAFFCYYEDTDTAWRLRLHGWRIRVAPAALVRHRHGASTKPGSAAFHRWNERNRLLMLGRCAPLGVAVGEVTRFTAITALLPIRALGLRLSPAARRTPTPLNFRLGLRLRVLGEVFGLLPAVLRERADIGRSATESRVRVWRRWAGR